MLSSVAPGPAPAHVGAGSDTSVAVAVVGGGASGTLCAIHLLASRAHDLAFTVFEASGELGRGIAYGTTDPQHLLNVRSRHMSAFPDIPSDLVEWAARTGCEDDAQAFLPRRDYACYLRETLDRLTDDRMRVRADRVTDLEPLPGGGFAVHTADPKEPTGSGGRHRPGGRSTTTAQTVVLAHGNARPAPLAVGGDDLPDAPWHLGDPWDVERLAGLAPDAVVVIVGSGLTAVDTAVSLLRDAPGRRVVMVSRQGLLPHAHLEQSSTAWLTPLPDGPVSADGLADLVLAQFAAARRRGVDWRRVVDGLRAPTPGLWQRMDLAERRRFLATHARNWEVRRHRMAPGVAELIAAHRDQGRLVLAGGGVAAVADLGSRCEVAGPGLAEPVRADALVNCTGPRADVTRTADPLLRRLVQRGLIGPDPLRLGVDCTPDGEVLDARGAVVPGLYVVGPPRKGVLWETTAVPEIRSQAAALATRLPEQLRALRAG